MVCVCVCAHLFVCLFVCACVKCCIRRGKILWKLKWKILGSRAKSVENMGKFASEEENPVKTQQFLAQWGQICGMWHQKMDKTQGHFFGAVGPKVWKNVGNLASEEGTSCENPVGPNIWQRCGKFCIRNGQNEGSWCNAGPKLWKNARYLRLHHWRILLGRSASASTCFVDHPRNYISKFRRI